MGVAQTISNNPDINSRIAQDMALRAKTKPLYWAIIDLEKEWPGESVNTFKQVMIESVVKQNPLARAIVDRWTLRVDHAPLHDYEFNGGPLSCFGTYQLLEKTRRAVQIQGNEVDRLRVSKDPVPFYLNNLRVTRSDIHSWLGELIPNLNKEPILQSRVMDFVTNTPEALAAMGAGIGAWAYDTHPVQGAVLGFVGVEAAVRGYNQMKFGRDLRFTSNWNSCLKMDTDLALFRDHPEYLFMSRQSTVYRASWLTGKLKFNWQYFPEVRAVTADRYLSTLQAKYQAARKM